MTQPHRILFLLPSIRRGGMERLVSILARGLDPDAYAPEIVVLHRRDENAALVDELPERVRLRSLDKRSRLDVVRPLRRLVTDLRRRRPVAAVGFMTYQNLMLTMASRLERSGIPVIATEHVTPDALRATRGKRLQLGLAGRVYRHAAAVVAVSDGLRQAMQREMGLPPDLLHVIYNPFDPRVDELMGEEPPDEWFGHGGPTLVAVGRLTAQKAYPVLLEALVEVRRELPARLMILGEGDERGALTALIERLGLGGAVRLPGHVPNPFPAMRRADAFVLASDWEAFPFVLVEAMRVGAATIATDSEFGPNEIIDNGRSGLLVPTRDPRALAAAILRVLRDPALAARLRADARERSEAFTPDEAIRRYSMLIEQVVADAAARLDTGRDAA